MAYISFLLFRVFIAFMGLIPFSILYRISDAFAYFFYKIIGYRKAIVQRNIRRCFPEKTEAERQKIAHESYRNFTDLILEVLKSPTMHLPDFREKRFVMHGVEPINAFIQEGRSVVVCGGHFGNWEWGPLSLPFFVKTKNIVPYKPLKNKYINAYLTKRRERAGNVEMIGIRDTFARFEQEEGNANVYILIADQSPSNRQRAQWVHFFNQETACLPGPDVLSRKYNYPVFYFEILRESRGHYKVTFHPLEDNPSQRPAGAINQAFVSALETTIKKQPGSWLWSHKRWKYSKADV